MNKKKLKTQKLPRFEWQRLMKWQFQKFPYFLFLLGAILSAFLHNERFSPNTILVDSGCASEILTHSYKKVRGIFRAIFRPILGPRFPFSRAFFE